MLFDFNNLDECECAFAFLDVANEYAKLGCIDWKTNPDAYDAQVRKLFSTIGQGILKASVV